MTRNNRKVRSIFFWLFWTAPISRQFPISSIFHLARQHDQENNEKRINIHQHQIKKKDTGTTIDNVLLLSVRKDRIDRRIYGNERERKSVHRVLLINRARRDHEGRDDFTNELIDEMKSENVNVKENAISQRGATNERKRTDQTLWWLLIKHAVRLKGTIDQSFNRLLCLWWRLSFSFLSYSHHVRKVVQTPSKRIRRPCRVTKKRKSPNSKSTNRMDWWSFWIINDKIS